MVHTYKFEFDGWPARQSAVFLNQGREADGVCEGGAEGVTAASGKGSRCAESEEKG